MKEPAIQELSYVIVASYHVDQRIAEHPRIIAGQYDFRFVRCSRRLRITSIFDSMEGTAQQRLKMPTK